METPDWLAPTSAPEEQSPTIEQTASQQQVSEGSYKSRVRDIALNETIFELMFEDTLDRVTRGHPLKDIVNDSPRQIDYASYYTWIKKDPQREKRYYEAREIGAEIVADELIAIADATDNPMEDVARSTLRINTRKFLLGVWNRRRYGDDRSSAASLGTGGITINIGEVVSPYQTTTTITPIAQSSPDQDIVDV